MPAEFIELAIPASLHAVRLLAAACQGVFSNWGLAQDRKSLLELALVEASTNVVRHAYRDLPAGLVRLRLCRQNGTIEIRVTDTGHSFDPERVGPPPNPDPQDPATWPEGGMGLYIIRSACDRLEYLTESGENTLILTVVEGQR
ncbi:MAG: ATP-binding protein [Acidobacteria bacterium]|nr:ATP-binding protein [Acidobacteriota bacterium]MCK6685709.1 ATP-binding protein [Thermoanaerobaculia bacterium]